MILTLFMGGSEIGAAFSDDETSMGAELVAEDDVAEEDARGACGSGDAVVATGGTAAEEICEGAGDGIADGARFVGTIG